MILAALAIVLAFVFGAGLRGAGQTSDGFALMGKAAPTLRGPTLGGGAFDLRSLRGSVVVVNMWASWCAPCRHELPLFEEASHRWAGSDLRIVTVNTRDGSATASEFLRKVNASDLLTVRDPEGRLTVAWGATGIPETFVVDRSGIVRAHWLGAVTWSWLRSEVARWTSA
jgi:cytochrome c biogenesis protein CcmG/thiol:disulfide interchange protein DsbE